MARLMAKMMGPDAQTRWLTFWRICSADIDSSEGMAANAYPGLAITLTNQPDGGTSGCGVRVCPPASVLRRLTQT